MLNVKEIRKRKNLTQDALAERVGVTQEAVSMWESGRAKPRADTLLELSKVLECGVDELLGSAG